MPVLCIPRNSCGDFKEAVSYGVDVLIPYQHGDIGGAPCSLLYAKVSRSSCFEVVVEIHQENTLESKMKF